MTRPLLVGLPLLLLALAAQAQDEWAARSALGARVRGQAVSALTTEGFTLGGAPRGWREDPALSFAVLRATVRPDEKTRDLTAAARFALEERLFADARSALAELTLAGADVSALDVSRIEAVSAFRSSGTLRRGVLEVSLDARDFVPTSFVGPLFRRLLPDHVLGFPLERPGGATLEAKGGRLVLAGTWPRAHGRPLAVLAASELAFTHEGLPSPNAYFGFDLVTAEETPVRALYAVVAEDVSKIDLQLVDGRGKTLEHVTTKVLPKTARLRLVAGPVCRLLADGREVARLSAASAFTTDSTNRAKPVLAIAAGPVARSEGRFSALGLAFTPDPTWLERASAAARSLIRSGLGLEPERWTSSGERFAIETDLGPSSLAAFAADLDAAFAAFERALGPARPGPKVTTRVFGTNDDYRAFVVAQGRGEEKCLGGFFDPRANCIVMKIDEASPRVRLVHEAFHAYAARALPDLPVWLSEGLAEREALRFAQVPPRNKRGPLLDALRRPREWRWLVESNSAEFHDRAVRARSGVRSAKEKRNYLLSWSLCEVAARKPGGVAAKLIARALEAARAGDALEGSEVDELALDEEWSGFAREVTGR